MFMVVSDDLKWCREQLGPVDKNVIINEDYGTVFEDMILVSLGAHTIISVGSYGTWGAILSKGKIIFPAQKISHKTYALQKHLKHVKDKNVKGLRW